MASTSSSLDKGKRVETAVTEEKGVESIVTVPKRPLWKRSLGWALIGGVFVIVAVVLGVSIPLSLRRSRDGDSGNDTQAGASTPSSSSSNNTASSPPAGSSVSVTAGMTWDYPLGFNLTAANAAASRRFYSVDLVRTSAADIAGLKAAGHVVACYFSAGSVESYRDDARNFSASAVGKVMKGWKDERWVDTRDGGVRRLMGQRIDLAAQKGCHGVDPDNIDAYDNDTGFALTQDDAVDYTRWLAGTARARGLLCGLKNGGAIVARVIDVMSWDIQEQCASTKECKQYKPFIDAGKPVFHVEYTDDGLDSTKTPSEADIQKACAADGVSGFSTIIKHMQLDGYIYSCQQ